MTEKEELVKLAKIQTEMNRQDDCDIFISKRDGCIVYANIKPVMKEVRMDFAVILEYPEKSLDKIS